MFSNMIFGLVVNPCIINVGTTVHVADDTVSSRSDYCNSFMYVIIKGSVACFSMRLQTRCAILFLNVQIESHQTLFKKHHWMKPTEQFLTSGNRWTVANVKKSIKQIKQWYNGLLNFIETHCILPSNQTKGLMLIFHIKW